MKNRKIFSDSIILLPEEYGLTPKGLMVQSIASEHLAEKLPLLFSFEIPADAKVELGKRVAAGEKLTLAELSEKYSPNPDDVNRLTSWLKQEGFDIIKISKDGDGVYTKATVEQIQKSLQIKMVRVTKEGLSYSAAQNEPSLPSEVANSVHAIIGLQPFRHAIKNCRMRNPKHGNRTAILESASASPAPSIQNAPPYLVSEILKAYNADNLGVNGKGQTIAILIDTVPLDSDLMQFWDNNNLNIDIAQIQKINVTGQQLAPPEGEETLDAEWSSGIAPGATIRIYATGSLQFHDLDMALDQIYEDFATVSGLNQLSISLGLGEIFMVKDEVNVQQNKFQKLAAVGVNVFVSSGDAGSNPDLSGQQANGPLQVEHASSDLSVIGVGGTSLKLTPTGEVSGEEAWVSSGGGKSIFFEQPSWQSGNGITPGGMRMVPDVSLTADPDNGAYLVLNGAVRQFGGTSWSAPVWAGFCALINEARANADKQALPYLNPVIYPLMGSSCFRDITNGSNGAYQAGTGYDMVTGIGVPNVKELINKLTQ